MGPEDLQGHWHRAWFKAPGVCDHETAVHWMQAGRIYADIRIPSGRPDVRGARALSDLSDAALLRLLTAEGFAGTITVEDDICTWAREINWHGTPETVDRGHMAFEGAGRLIETGVDADYAELWHRRADKRARAMHLTAETRHAYLVTIGKSFVFGVATPGVAASASMIASLQAGQRSRALHEHFANVFAFGRWLGGRAMVDLCTNPLIEGQAILTCRAQDDLVWHAVDFLGRSRDVPLTDRTRAQHDAA